MYRIMNKGIPNFRSHFVSTDDVLQGGRLITKSKTSNGIKHTGMTAIDPNNQIVHVTDELGKKLEKCPEILVVEKVADAPKA